MEHVVTVPCPDCCATAIACAGLECRTRGGTASLCGHEEYTSPSSPPKKYRVQTYTGQVSMCLFGTSDCSGNVGEQNRVRDEYSGAFSYSAADCSTGDTGSMRRLNATGLGAGPCADDAGTLAGTFNISSSNPFNTTLGQSSWFQQPITSTQKKLVGIASCSGGSFGQKTAGEAAATLSIEDTESDAFTRLNPAWSGWSSCGGTPPLCCLARYELRSSGFSFIIQEAEWRVTVTGLTAGKVYSIDVNFFRRVFGIGLYTLFQTGTFVATADGLGAASFSGTVPNEVGFETYAICA